MILWLERNDSKIGSKTLRKPVHGRKFKIIFGNFSGTKFHSKQYYGIMNYNRRVMVHYSKMIHSIRFEKSRKFTFVEKEFIGWSSF
jgi:hypothetical protein